MIKLNKIILTLGLLLLIGCKSITPEEPIVRQEDCPYDITYKENGTCVYSEELNISDETINGSTFFTSNISFNRLRFEPQEYLFYSMNANFTFMNMTCHEVRCDCMDWGCMAYCMSCTGLNTENSKKENK